MDLKKLSDKELKELVRQKERSKCEFDLWYLCTEVLGYKDMGEVHKPLCQIVESINPLFWFKTGDSPWKDIASVRTEVRSRLDAIVIPDIYKPYIDIKSGTFHRLFLMFRSGFKSTILNIAHCIQLMIIYPDIRILIASHKKDDGAQPFLRSIKHHFVSNTRFRTLFPEYCPKPNKIGQIEWDTKDSVTLPNRSPEKAFPEASVETAGINTNVTGRHYDIIKADDLVTKDSVTNETMIQKTREQNSLLDFLFDQPEWGVKDVIGTPYHFADIYNDISKSDRVVKVRIPATHEDGKPTFPERFTEDGIQNIKNAPAMTSYEFSCQYMLNPVPTEDQTFRPEWFEYLDFYYDKLPDNLRLYMFIDPANSKKKKSDYTAIVVLGIDQHDKIYLVDIIRDKVSTEDRTNLVFDIAQKHDLKVVYYEAVGFQDTDRYIVEKKARDSKYHLTVKPIKASSSSKEDRIRGLQPIYERGMIRWPKRYMYTSKYDRKTYDMVSLLRDEMIMFPKCQHDDMIDCHSFFLQIYSYKAGQIKPKKEPDNQFDVMRKHHNPSSNINNDKDKSKPYILGRRNKSVGIPFKKSPFST